MAELLVVLTAVPDEPTGLEIARHLKVGLCPSIRVGGILSEGAGGQT